MEEFNLNADIPEEVLSNLLYYTKTIITGGNQHARDCVTMFYIKTKHKGKKKESSCLSSFYVEYERLDCTPLSRGDTSYRANKLIKLLESKLLSKRKMSKVEDLKKEFLRSSESADEFAMGVVFALEEIGKVTIDEAF